MNTILTLSDSTGVQVVQNNDTDAASRNFCSRISRSLTPGDYLLSVTAGLSIGGTAQSGRYRLAARAGP